MAMNGFEAFADLLGADGSQASDTRTGTVTRVDDEGTPWVSFDGSDAEMPVHRSYATVQPGDTVPVRVRNGRSEIPSNASDLPASTSAVAGVSVQAMAAVENAAIASSAAASAVASAQAAGDAAASAQDSLKSVVAGATTVEKAVSVMQTALEAVVDYDPDTDTTTEYFWHDANGAHVLGDTSGYRNDIDSTGMDIVEVSTEDSVAKFGAGGSQIGKDDESHLELDYHSMQLIDKEGNTYFFISDFRNVYGVADITEAYTANGEDTDFGNMLTPTMDAIHVYIDDVETTEFELMHPSVTSYYISLDNAPASGAEVRIEYKTRSSLAKGFTIGVRKDGNVGAYSTAIGNSTLANGTYSVAIGSGADASGYGSIAIGGSSATGTKSVAFGFGNVSSGLESFAIGSQTEASGTAAYAEGYRTVSSREYAHSEGSQTTADGRFSHAEGVHSTAKHDGAHAEGSASMAKGQYSHAQNSHTTAAKVAQTALGTYNIEDASSTTTHPSGSNGYGKYAVIVGNGTADNARSNALAVEWNGNVRIAGDVQDMSGNLRYAPIAYGSYTNVTAVQNLTTSAQKINYATFSGTGCSPSSNGIKVSNAGTYMIWAGAYFTAGYNEKDIVHLAIYKNSTSMYDHNKRLYDGNPYETVTAGPIILTLAANDVIYGYAYNQSGARGKIGSKYYCGLVIKRIA